MRLDQTPENQRFAQWLLQVGDGQNIDNDGKIVIPQTMKCNGHMKDLIQTIYGQVLTENARLPTDEYLQQRTILATLNVDVDGINNQILDKFPGRPRTYHSADNAEEAEGAIVHYPPEYLQSITPSGFPQARLRIKLGMPLIILRNLAPGQGLCNGTRIVVTKTARNLIEGRILGGDHAGNTVFIPRITLITEGNDLPFVLRRRQFPVRPAFAMTINKSQGQSVRFVGLDLRTPVFSHGQLYVALSRCTSADRIKVLFDPQSQSTKTKNVVYPEVLLRRPL